MRDSDTAELAHTLCLRYTGRLRSFVELHFPALEDETDDVVQSILEKALRRLRLFDDSYAESTWVYAIARNHCIDLIRRQRRWKLIRNTDSREGDPARIRSRFPGPEDTAVENDELRRMKNIVASLPTRERQVLWLSVYEEMSFREISRVMDIPEGTAKYLKHRAKKMIQEKWEE